MRRNSGGKERPFAKWIRLYTYEKTLSDKGRG